jgi:basic amino acid/polyamine antiporter, APA family
MALKRSIGRWALTGLMINSIIGSGIFGVPGELLRLLGPASPVAFLLAGLAIGVIVACFVEVGSQFSEAGGPYLYVRTAFGRFLGIQVAWFTALAPMAAAAAQANLFVSYLAGFAPSMGSGISRSLVITGLISLPVIANLFGARGGKSLSNILVVAKLSPLLILIVAGLLYTGYPTEHRETTALATPGLSLWFSAVLLAVFSFGGFENALAATGDVKEPSRTVPFALAASLVVCVIIYTLIQLVTAMALDDTNVASRPLAAAASIVLGPRGAMFVGVAAMISTSGAVSATVLVVPRLLAALSQGGDMPAFFARVHTNSGAPVIATMTIAALIVLLGITGTFKWALAVTSGSMMIMAGAVCASLPRLRISQPQAAAVRVPGGGVLAVMGVGLSVLLLLQLEPKEAAPITITMVIAAVNWILVKGRRQADSIP